MTTISNNLKRLREAKTRLGQKEMARILGVEQSTYCNWESGTSDVKSEYIPKIAEILDVEIKDLFKSESQKIKRTQNNSNNKDQFVNNSIVLIIPDKESVDKLVEILKFNIDK